MVNVSRPSMHMRWIDDAGRMTPEAYRIMINLWERSGGVDDTAEGSLQASNNLDDVDSASISVVNLGFVSAIFDKRSPGAIGAISPSTAAFTTLTGTTITSTSQINLANFTVATLPSAATNGGFIFVTDETGGAVPAFSDTTNWRRVTDRAIVS